jgi:hyperosmotically inducible protein
MKANAKNKMMVAYALAGALSLPCLNNLAHAGAGSESLNQSPLETEFKKLDINHDSKLSSEEIARDKDFAGNFERADTNGDGALVADEYGNFKSAAQQKRLELFLDDSAVTARVKAELVKDTGMKGLNISVETYKGEVILSGFVENDEQMRRAVQIASGVRGVQAVKSGLSVKG